MSPNLHWTLDPGVLAAGALVGGAYAVRWVRVRRELGAAAAPGWRAACFAGALSCGVGALVSPIDGLADQLFFMHMVQHVLLLDVAPVLGLLGLNRVLLRPATRAVSTIERSAGVLAHPVFAVFLYVAVIWAWHVPDAYDLALRDSIVHALEHLTFLLAGGLYWWHLLGPIRSRLRLGGMGPVVYMASTKLLVGALGMGLAFVPGAHYPYYVQHAGVWGLTAGDDQSIAGLAMAIEQSMLMGAALAWLFMRMLAESEREQQRRERFEAEQLEII